MISSEPWDMVEDREFWGRVALPCVHGLARLGGAIARRREADRTAAFFSKMAWFMLGAQLAISTEMQYLAAREKNRQIAEREQEDD